MASIETRTSQTGAVTYRVKWHQAGKQQSETRRTKKDAKEFRGMVDANGQRWPENWVPGFGLVTPSTTHLTVAQWCARAIAARSGIEERTRSDYRGHLNRHLGRLAPIRIDELSREDVGRWVAALQLAPKTVKNIHGILSSCLTDAVRDGHIDRNPAEGIRLPRVDGPDRKEIIPLTTSDIDLIICNIADHYRTLVRLLAETGMRWSEATALTVRRVDVFTKRITVAQAWKRQEDSSMIIGPTKTKRSNRSLVITEELRDQLVPLLAAKHANALVFTAPNGGPVRNGNFRDRVWLPAIERAQRCKAHEAAPDACGCDGTLIVTPRIHDLRHSHASLLISAGVPLVKVQRRLGHESIQTTADTYGHLMPDSDGEIRAALSQASIRGTEVAG